MLQSSKLGHACWAKHMRYGCAYGAGGAGCGTDLPSTAARGTRSSSRSDHSSSSGRNAIASKMVSCVKAACSRNGLRDCGARQELEMTMG